MNFLLTLIILVLILGIIIFIHEFGHFLAAKKSGVYVPEFSMGMGPKVWSKKSKKSETTYSLRLLPIGGFVSMANEEDKTLKIKKDQILENKSFIKRFLVLIMGILFNFILTIILLFLNGLIFGSPETKPVIGEIVENSPSQKQGLKSGDVIVEVNNVNVLTWDDVLLEISVKEAQQKYTFVIERDGNRLEKEVIPEQEKVDGVIKNSFGFGIGQSKKYGFINAIKYSIDGFIGMFRSIFVVLGNLITGKVAANNLSGPVGIYTIIDQIKDTGLENIIYLLAYLSVNVGVINLLPIPVFDGGRILLLIVEKITRRKYPKLESILNVVGFILLILLMIFVTFNDILKIVWGKYDSIKK